MPGQFRSYVWDPVLIIAQILSMQSAFYLGLGLWVVVVDYILASHRSLDRSALRQAMPYSCLILGNSIKLSMEL